MTLRKGLVAIGAVALLALGACSGGTTSTSTSSAGGAMGGPTVAVTTPVVTAPPVTITVIPPVTTPPETIVEMSVTGDGPSSCKVGESRDQMGACAPCPDFEGCFTSPEQMQYFYDQIILAVTAYSTATYVQMPDVSNWYYIPTGATGPEACVDAQRKPAYYTAFSYEYCPSDKNIYVGEQSLWKYYSELGDAGPAIAIAHEWGHHVQNTVGVFDDEPETAEQQRLNTVQSENQADCIAGSWLGWEITQGKVNQDDLADIDAIIATISDNDDDLSRTHGTLQERTDSFILGMQQGIYGCNGYFPETPVFVK